MNFSNVYLIFKREVRDQLRDRRTLFMIFVLPVLLYPFMGMSMFQLMQFIQEHPTRVLIVGADELPEHPELIRKADKQQNEQGDYAFVADWFSDREEAGLLEVYLPEKQSGDGHAADQDPGAATDEMLEEAQTELKEDRYQAVIYFPPGFARSLAQFREQLASGRHEPPPEVASPRIYYNTAKKKSQVTYSRVARAVRDWREAIVKYNLRAADLPETVATPFTIDEPADVADVRHRNAAMWSTVFPLLLLIWSLTGAFYPAIDLCAGEKERGTLETLLSSPAERTEIVWGKLLTIMLFSVATVTLNLVAVGATGWFFITGDVAEHLPGLGPPPLLSFVWLFLAVLPVAAMFSALCLALAAFARSTKEGQYYLMPLFLVTMPLVALPLSPSFELNLGNSLIPVTGVVLVLRSAIEGDYLEAARYMLPVGVVTAVCCLLALRWAIDQFNRESVLFRESERFDLGLWLRHLVRDRGPTPTAAMAFLCAAVILLVKFGLGLVFSGNTSNVAVLTVVVQIVAILTPAVLMTVMLTRSPRQTLLLRKPPLLAVPAAVALALLLHPLVQHLSQLVQWMYPLNPRIAAEAEKLFQQMPGLGTQLMLIAVLAPLCEELAFRGFILSGFRHLGRKKLAILLSSLFFGMAHSVLQQSITACIFGTVIAYVAIQCGSLLPAIAYHMVHNGMSVCVNYVGTHPQWIDRSPLLRFWLGPTGASGWLYSWPVAVVCGILALGILAWFRRLPFQMSEEESLQEALARHAHDPLESAPPPPAEAAEAMTTR